MAGRIRTIKPELLDDEVASGLSDRAWRLWVSSWLLADDHGNLRAHERHLAANIWQDTSVDVGPAIAELVAKGRWQVYAVSGQRYAHIRNFDRHQRVDNRGKPRVPGPELDDGSWSEPAPSSRRVAPEPTKVQEVSGRFAENLREPPRTSASLGDSPLRARAPSPTSDHDHDLDPDPRAGACERVREVRFEAGSTASFEALEVYADAVRAALGTGFALNARYRSADAGALVAAVTAHAPSGLGLAETVAWVRSSATAWVRATPPEARQYVGGWRPSKWLDWLNAGPKAARAARPAGGAAEFVRTPPRNLLAPAAPLARAELSAETRAKLDAAARLCAAEDASADPGATEEPSGVRNALLTPAPREDGPARPTPEELEERRRQAVQAAREWAAREGVG